MPLVKSAWQTHCKNKKYHILKRMPSITTSVTYYTVRQVQACEGRTGGRIEPWRDNGARALNFSPLDKPPSRCRRGCPAVPSLYGFSSGYWDCSAQRNRAQKEETRVDRRSTRVFVFSRAWRVLSCVYAAWYNAKWCYSSILKYIFI